VGLNGPALTKGFLMKDKIYSFNVDPKYIKQIKDGTKKNALKGYYIPVENKRVLLVNSETDKVDLVIKVGHIFDLTILTKEEKEIIMDENNIAEELRPYFACNYMYTIDKIEIIQ